MRKLVVLLLALMMVLGSMGCGTETKKKDTTKKAVVENEAVEETAQSEVKDDKADVEVDEEAEITENSTQSEAPKNTQSDSTQPAETTVTKNSSTGSGNGNMNNNTNKENTTPSTPTHEHNWQPVKLREYQVIKNYVNGCNGCGYPLFTIGENGAQHIENLYFHPACYSERLGGDCTGGGFHSESYTSGYCGLCGGKVSYRQCMWTENGKRCIKNEAAGPYEKVEFDQNYFMYFDSCDCGRNLIIVGDAGGIVYGDDVCNICGETKKPYE